MWSSCIYNKYTNVWNEYVAVVIRRNTKVIINAMVANKIGVHFCELLSIEFSGDITSGCIGPAPYQENHPQIMIDLPPYFIVGFVYFGLNDCFSGRQTYRLP